MKNEKGGVGERIFSIKQVASAALASAAEATCLYFCIEWVVDTPVIVHNLPVKQIS
ncbi:hypothetical protein D3C84_596240 [compost metagenome]